MLAPVAEEPTDDDRPATREVLHRTLGSLKQRGEMAGVGVAQDPRAVGSRRVEDAVEHGHQRREGKGGHELVELVEHPARGVALPGVGADAARIWAMLVAATRSWPMTSPMASPTRPPSIGKTSNQSPPTS